MINSKILNFKANYFQLTIDLYFFRGGDYVVHIFEDDRIAQTHIYGYSELRTFISRLESFINYTNCDP